jgi:type IV secretory pathway VirB4 component
MFARKEKPLPVAVLKPPPTHNTRTTEGEGIHLGEGYYWNPSTLPNSHIVAIGASGSGKTQTLKAIAFSLHQTYPQMQIILLDFHGDQEIVGETCYPIHMASPHGINPLVVNLDPIRYLLKEHYPGETVEIRYYEHLADWQDLIKLENYLIQIHQPPLNQTTLRTECKDSQKLKLKLAATFQYGVFSRPQPELSENLVRIDLSKLPPSLAALSAESLAAQLMNQHRLKGEIQGRLPRTFLFIDEAKEMPKTEGSACDRIIADGRKYGLSLVLASQSERHLSQDVIGNSATKIVLPVDQTEVNKVAKKFRFAEKKVASLTPLTALCRFGKEAELLEIQPYYQRIKNAQ